jgi:hypothetical protein
MPIIENSTYSSRGVFRNPHINTVYAALFRPAPSVDYSREQIHTPDGDFLDLDWSVKGSSSLVVLLHGLEGSAARPYITSMARFFNQHGWDALGLNFRGCSGTPNLLPRSYHMGETGDLNLVIQHALKKYRYQNIALVGFSLGGNVLLKYLGEDEQQVPPEIVGGVAFSVPCDILHSNVEIDRWFNRHYLWKFLISLNQKMREKAARFPQQVPLPRRMPRNFKEFDDQFTAPIHGFKDAVDYWTSSGSIRFLPTLCRPALMVNALDDTFLSKQCYPYAIARQHPALFLETPPTGGHVGFVEPNKDNIYWAERRAYAFIQQLLG